MNTANKTQIVKDLNEKSILVSREFNAPIETVWRAYTDSEILEQWWGPAPWHVETKTMNFTPGGYWLYAMVGPEGEKHWARMNYIAIDMHKSYDMEDGFCDENGNMNPAMPLAKGKNVFTPTANGTRVDFKLTYAKESDIQMIVEMGFEQGISMCIEQLDALIVAKKI